MQDLPGKEVSSGKVIQGNFPQNGKVLLSYRRDIGDEWKYWDGVNWFALKKNALAVDVNKVAELETRWGFRARQEKVAT